MNDAEHVHELVHPRPRMVDYLKLMLLGVGTVTVVCLASWAMRNAFGASAVLAPVIPTATFVALLDRVDLPAIPEGGRCHAFLAGVAGILYAAGSLSGSA